MNRSLKIANYFIKKSFDDGIEMTPMKLVKLAYIAHGYHLAITNGTPLIKERIEAWPYGPVIPSLYRSFKKYGRSGISQMEEDEETGKVELVSDEETKLFLDKIWEAYGHLSGLQLSTLAHQKGTPWDKAKKKVGVSVIPNREIQAHYEKMVV